MTTKKSEKFNFEAALQKLEKIVAHMERGDLSLEDSLKSFEEGVTLTKQCQQTLKEAEQKVQILSGKNSDSLETFSVEE